MPSYKQANEYDQLNMKDAFCLGYEQRDQKRLDHIANLYAIMKLQENQITAMSHLHEDQRLQIQRFKDMIERQNKEL